MNNKIINNIPKTLNIDAETLSNIQKAFLPNICQHPPKGYYNTIELAKILKISKSSVIRRIRTLLKTKSIDVITCRTLDNSNRTIYIPYYKIL